MVEFIIFLVVVFLLFLAYEAGKLRTKMKYLRLIGKSLTLNEKALMEGWDKISELHGAVTLLTYADIANRVIDAYDVLLELDKNK